jgi:hypothetical protein
MIARWCLNKSRLAASYFISLGGGELESARKLVTSIAVQLAQHSLVLQ